jgi:hypothetical protein
MAKHTPGPWKAAGDFIGTDEADPQTIAYVSDHRNRRPRGNDVDKANARLIAAAPELLEALQDCKARLRLLIDSDRHKLLDTAAVRKAIAAIAKATGETND